MKKSICLLLGIFLFGMFVFAADADDKPSVTPYGYIKMDLMYETGSSSHENYTLWAKNPGNSDGMFYVTARQTRLGLKIKGFSFGKFTVTGKVEVDFHSSGVPENKAYNFMRHAFLEVTNGSFSIIAGQTSDIISPLYPSTLNYPVLWGAGNIGYRRPQFGFKQVIKGGKSVITLQAGIFRTIAGDYDGDGIDDGIESTIPTVQARIGGNFSLGGSASLQLGVSGHYGESDGLVKYTSNSINLDCVIVFSPKFKILGEYFTGKNLGTFLGGIAQSVNLAKQEEIEAKGYFVNAVASVSPKTSLSVGYGMDDPNDANLSTGARAKNSCIFGNIVIKLSPSLQTGLEVSNWITDYLDAEQQKTLRFQHCWILSF